MKKLLLLFLYFQLLISFTHVRSQVKDSQLKVGVIGLTHTHVHWILGRPDLGDIKIVGIVESNRDLAKRYADQHGFSMDIVFDTMEDMITAKKPEAVTAFGSIYDHLNVVQTCAPLGIHVMVEKPLAVSLEHAKKMKALADKHGIHLLTNYETTWYGSNHKAYEKVVNGDIGELRKIVVHDGHQGPIEIGVNKEFLDWLTDPVLNGGGALTDFGCYGANLITWLMNGEKPEAVMAMTQTIKPDLYPNVDDEATILLKYPKAQGIIQASWNWPESRKDMEVYGQLGYIISENDTDIRYRLNEDSSEIKEKVNKRSPPFNDPFTLLSEVVRGNIKLDPYDLSSIENNMIVMEILDAAKESAANGKLISLKK
jgi:predicted dehydrogenase